MYLHYTHSCCSHRNCMAFNKYVAQTYSSLSAVSLAWAVTFLTACLRFNGNVLHTIWGIDHDMWESQYLFMFRTFLVYIYMRNNAYTSYASVCVPKVPDSLLTCLSLSKIPCHPFLPSGPFQDRFLNPKYPPFVALSSRWPIFQMADRLACEAGSCPESHVFALGLFRTQSISHLMSYIW